MRLLRGQTCGTAENPGLHGDAAKNSYLTRRDSGSRNYHEGVVGGRSTFRPPDAALESQDEGIHLWRAQRDTHHRPAEDAEDVPGSKPVRRRNYFAWANRVVCGNQATGAGSDCRRSETLRRIFRESPLAGRNADQLVDAAEIDQAD